MVGVYLEVNKWFQGAVQCAAAHAGELNENGIEIIHAMCMWKTMPVMTARCSALLT